MRSDSRHDGPVTSDLEHVRQRAADRAVFAALVLLGAAAGGGRVLLARKPHPAGARSAPMPLLERRSRFASRASRGRA